MPEEMGITIVCDEEARATVVMSSDPSLTALYATEELVEHIREATGVVLPTISETEMTPQAGSLIYIGDTTAAREQGIRAGDLKPDGFALHTSGNAVYVVGNEERTADPLDEDVSDAGTLFGVYELLERCLGVCWLWPGKLGTHIPETDTVVIERGLDETHAPRLAFRRFAWYQVRRAAGDYDPDLERLSFSPGALHSYSQDLNIYLRRHRLGYSEPKPPTQHHFSGWWERYGGEHPEWFMMREDGGRGPAPDATERGRKHVAMCVSNPDLHRFIVEEDWDGGQYLPLGEVDVRVFCQCENCRAWDGPQPDDYPDFVRSDFEPRVVSDRYARFWKTVHALAARRNPEVKVTTFLYWNYLPAPRGDIRLHENIYGEFVPWTGVTAYYPMPAEAQRWLREQWLGWRETGISIAYRPNYFHGGYVMPHFSTHQAADFLRFASVNGMQGFRYDSLFGDWAVKGPMFYIHMRLAWDPGRDVGELREEFFTGFGPAASRVERYFDYWEDYARTRPGGSLYNPTRAHEAYPPEVFAPARELLEEAREATGGHGVYAERVAFLRAGLEHARLAARFMGTLDSGQVPEEPGRLNRSREALRDLVAFRREHEDLYVADFLDAARRENRRVDAVDRLLP